MRSDVSRREFIAGLGLLAAARGKLSATPFPSPSGSETPRLGKSPFKIAVINDEISQDFGHACEIASQKFGMKSAPVETPCASITNVAPSSPASVKLKIPSTTNPR